MRPGLFTKQYSPIEQTAKIENPKRSVMVQSRHKPYLSDVILGKLVDGPLIVDAGPGPPEMYKDSDKGPVRHSVRLTADWF